MSRVRWGIMLGSTLLAVTAYAEEPQLFRTPMDKVNYGIGVETARNFRNQGVEINLDLLIKGLQDELSGNVMLPEKELRKIMTGFQNELRRKRTATKRSTAVENSSPGETLSTDTTVKLP